VKVLKAKMMQHDHSLSLHVQGKLATKIHHDLNRAFGELAIACLTVMRNVRESSWAIPKEDVRDLGGRPPNHEIDARIRRVLDELPDTSIRQIANEAEIPASTFWYLSKIKTGYLWRKCRLVPHAFIEAQRQQWPKQSQLLLTTLRRAKSTGWRSFSTGDESWFFYYTPHQGLWVRPDMDAPEVSRRLIATPKLMVAVFWGFQGFTRRIICLRAVHSNPHPLSIRS
jgi:hypothetical protein